MDGPHPSMRRIVSAPALHAGSGSRANGSGASPAQDNGLELFVANRSFTSWCNGIMTKLPTNVAETVRAAGVCHFLVVAREKQSGQLYMWDFGPVGGRDTTLRVEAVYDARTAQVKTGAPGEIREQVISAMPEGAMYVGSTQHWSLDDIRRYNTQQPTVYKLHENDCRHYVNNLVRQVTGLEQASVRLLRCNYEQRTRSSKDSWLKQILGTAELPAAQPGSSDSSSSPDTAAPAGGVHVHGTQVRTLAAATLGVLYAAPVAQSVPAGQAGIHPAAPLLLPLLASLPAPDAPVVMLGHVLTNPYNWQQVHAAGQAALMYTGALLGARMLGITRAATAAMASANAGAAATAASAPVRAAMGAWPQLVQQWRAAAVPPAVTDAASRMGAGLGHSARALAAHVKARAAQVTAPLVAIAHSRSQKLHRVSSSGQSGCGEGPAHSALKGGLLPLPLRPQQTAGQQGAPVTSGASVVASSAMAVPAMMLPSTSPASSATDAPSPTRRLRWPFMRRKAVAAPSQPALLPAATLQAAVMPEGPSPSTLVPRRRLFPLITRSRPTVPPGEPRMTTVSWMGRGGQRTTLFQLACAPLSWLGMTTRRAQDSATSVVILGPAALPPPSAPVLPLWHAGHVRPSRLPPALPSSQEHGGTEEVPRAGAMMTRPVLADVIQPLDTSPHAPTTAWLVGSRSTWLRFTARAQRPPSATITSVHAFPAPDAPGTAADDLAGVHAAAGATTGPALHMPSLPVQSKVRRRFLFSREPLGAQARALGRRASRERKAWTWWTHRDGTTSSWASLLAILITHVAQLHQSRQLLIA